MAEKPTTELELALSRITSAFGLSSSIDIKGVRFQVNCRMGEIHVAKKEAGGSLEVSTDVPVDAVKIVENGKEVTDIPAEIGGVPTAAIKQAIQENLTRDRGRHDQRFVAPPEEEA